MFERDLDRMLKPYPPRMAALFHQLVALVQEIRPDFTAKVSNAWQTVNFHLPKHGFIMAIYGARGDKVLLVFQDGRLLDSPMLTDDGKVKKVRWIPFGPGDDIPVDDIAILIAEAVALRS
ncbi:MAG: hypothetical protein ABIY37_17020 [Devosia sp.]